jgi:hypothetical protein
VTPEFPESIVNVTVIPTNGVDGVIVCVGVTFGVEDGVVAGVLAGVVAGVPVCVGDGVALNVGDGVTV